VSRGRRAALVAGAATVAIGLAIPVTGVLAGGGPDLAGVRAASAAFHDVDTAEAAGYSDLGLCVSHMGEHWVNLTSEDGDAAPDSFQDGVQDPAQPEALVYAHHNGKLRLVAVEWVSTGPGTVPGIGELHLNPALGVYVLHAWVWANNPDGMLADMNPTMHDCPA
jgi:hypothetical protein